MDKVKAIEVLKPLVESYVDHANITMKEEDDDIAYALEMAVEALKALDVPDTNVGDMISRQAAIDLFPDDDLEYDTKGGYIAPHLARRMICELPFAQPDHNADVSKKVEGDCISRQAAIDAMGKAKWAKERLMELPSAQPEQHWIPCSEKPDYDFQNVLVKWHDKRKGCENDYYLFEGYVVRGIWCGMFEGVDMSYYEPVEWMPLEG